LETGKPLFCREGKLIWPHSLAHIRFMRTLVVIFVLALITLAGEIYSDAILTGGQVMPAASDPIALAVGHATQSE
jgi:hypothetical protein